VVIISFLQKFTNWENAFVREESDKCVAGKQTIDGGGGSITFASVSFSFSAPISIVSATMVYVAEVIEAGERKRVSLK
jgi:hypothetical protein